MGQTECKDCIAGDAILDCCCFPSKSIDCRYCGKLWLCETHAMKRNLIFVYYKFSYRMYIDIYCKDHNFCDRCKQNSTKLLGKCDCCNEHLCSACADGHKSQYCIKCDNSKRET